MSADVPIPASSRFKFSALAGRDMDLLIMAAREEPAAAATAGFSLPYAFENLDHWRHTESAAAACQKREWVISRVFDGRVVGYCALDRIGVVRSQAHLQFWFGCGHAGRLHTESERAAECLAAVFDLAAGRLGLTRLYAFQLVRQPRVAGLLAGAGMRQEGFVQRRLHKQGMMEALAHWAIAFATDSHANTEGR